MQVEAGLMKID